MRDMSQSGRRLVSAAAHFHMVISRTTRIGTRKVCLPMRKGSTLVVVHAY